MAATSAEATHDAELRDRAQHIIRMAIEEDLPDVTSMSIFGSVTECVMVRGKVMAKENGVACGLFVIPMVFAVIDEKYSAPEGRRVAVTLLAKDGDTVAKGDVVAHVDGPVVSVLSGERTALNFVQRLSGISTKTRSYVDAVRHTRCRILDTRKTLPGYRVLEKYAVKTGGGVNHRMSLADMILIKDNHITAAGGITAAVTLSRKQFPGLPIEVEVANQDQLREALSIEPLLTRIMLDNMSVDQLRACVLITSNKVPLEASGGINMTTLAAVAETGVDFVSVGSITHSVPALDFNMKIEEKPQENLTFFEEHSIRVSVVLSGSLFVIRSSTMASLADTLWDGFEKCIGRLDLVIRMEKEYLAFFEKRARLERDYGKELHELCRVHPGGRSPAVDKVERTLKETMLAISESGSKVGAKHNQIAVKIVEEIIKPLEIEIKTQESNRRKVFSGGSCDIKFYTDAIAVCNKTRENYVKACKDAEYAKQQYLDAEVEVKATPESRRARLSIALSKFGMERKQSIDKANQLEMVYQNAILAANNAQKKLYVEDIPHLLAEIQTQMEFQFTFLDKCAKAFLSMQLELPSDYTASVKMLSTAVSELNWSADLQEFIGTSRNPIQGPTPLAFIPFEGRTPDLPPDATGSTTPTLSSSGPLSTSSTTTTPTQNLAAPPIPPKTGTTPHTKPPAEASTAASSTPTTAHSAQSTTKSGTPPSPSLTPNPSANPTTAPNSTAAATPTTSTPIPTPTTTTVPASPDVLPTPPDTPPVNAYSYILHGLFDTTKVEPTDTPFG
ncbi:carboxylating nicotinate-nucleotide diphosphorylase [Pelomyxa schiedti]|nr:carboxylating nicotinate-nucleotide diphosphorylase [Pelomyxa schiedti]